LVCWAALLVAATGVIGQQQQMRCYSVMIIGSLTHHITNDDEAPRANGYYVIRYVLARDAENACRSAFARELRLLERADPDVRSGLTSVTFEADEVLTAPWSRLLRRRYGRAYWLE
jgi:hypothetical protein